MAHALFRRLDPAHSPLLDWLLILAGALAAWLFWPASPP